MLQPKKPLKQKVKNAKEKLKIAKAFTKAFVKVKLTPPSKETRDFRKEMKRERDALKEEFPDAVEIKQKGGTAKDGKWIQKAINPKHKGYCTPMSKPTCTPKRKALARTLKKMAKNK